MSTVTVNLDSAHSPKIFTEFKYSAGEWQVRFPDIWSFQDTEVTEVVVVANIHNADDIVRLALLKSAIPQPVYTKLLLPYLPYSRADRRFTDGDCCGLEVFGQLIGSMNFDTVLTLDAHNAERASFYVPSLIDVYPEEFIWKAIAGFSRKRNSDTITVLFPDEGARKRYTLPARLACNIAHIDINVLHCNKKRDPVTGALLGFDVPQVNSEHPAIIVDDICDGGGTFVGIAKSLHDQGLPTSLRALYVTHGIFSKGFGELNTYFDHIYTTNSFPEKGSDSLVTVFDCMPMLLKKSSSL